MSVLLIFKEFYSLSLLFIPVSLSIATFMFWIVSLLDFNSFCNSAIKISFSLSWN